MLAAMDRKTPLTLIALCIACAAVWLPIGRAAAQDGAPPALDSEDEDDEHGNFLNIPGIGKIPLPPGARAFGPGNPPRGFGRRELGPRQHGPQSATPAPAPPKTVDQRRVEAQARLLARLADAADEQEAQSVAALLLRQWGRSGSDTIDLLAARALAAEAGGAPPLARSLLDHIVALSPYWPEGFVRRARVRTAQGDVSGALGDLETAARLEPKRFDALAALGALSESAGDKKRALEAYRRALVLSPRQDDLRKREERLRFEIEGRDI